MVTARRVLITGLMIFSSSICACIQPADPVLSSAEQIELQLLRGQLLDPSRSAQTKIEAALLLLNRPYPQASQQLYEFLTRSDNRSAQIAIAEAIARRGGRNKKFVAPLTAMLTGIEPSVRAPAARALVTYENFGVTEKLIVIVKDARRARVVRLVIIAGLQNKLDKRAVDTLVSLLDDPNPAIRDAAADSLSRLMNIQTFDYAQWKAWWRRNKDKPRSVWMADLANCLARAKTTLESENKNLRKRLVKTKADLYAATPPAQRDGALLNMAKDPLSNIRLLALELVERRINANQAVADELRLQVGAMLADVDPRVRQKSALLIANLGGKDVSEQLLSRLNDEKVQSVRQGLLTALGQLRESKALEVVLEEIGSNYDDVCAAAAIALARIASKQPLTEPQHDRAAKVLVDRYHQKSDSGDGVAIREALLTAMGVVTHENVAKVLVEALDEEAATVRLAAVNSLAQLGKTEFATALEPLTADPDRGVRQAAITALGKLDGAAHLQTILKRTHASVEADGTVRKQAWDVVMAVLAKADSDLLWSLSASLAKRPDAAEQVVKVNRMLVAALKKSKDKKLPAAQRQLARSLMKIPLAAEAALNLAEAYTALQQAKSPQALQVWLEWIEAMLAGDDITVIKVISRNKDALTFAQGCDRLEARLKEMLDEGKYDQVALIAADAVKQLANRLDTDRKNAINAILDAAAAKQLQADRRQIAKLVQQLLGGNDAASKAAGQLKSMGDRAVGPLLEELKNTVVAETTNLPLEKAIMEILTQLAPKINDYDLQAPKTQRLQKVYQWVGDLDAILAPEDKSP